MLAGLIPAAQEGWNTLLDLGGVDTDSWLLVGGQMMYLLAAENGVEMPRATADLDVVVDVRARPGGTEWLAGWLTDRGYDMAGVSPDGIGHKFMRPATTGPGVVEFDVLGPEGVGERKPLFTRRPARTVQAPGSVQAFARSSVVPVTVLDAAGSERTGRVRRPDVLGALVAKAAATTIPVRKNRERDWQDSALLLCLLADPVAAAAGLSKKDKQRLRLLSALHDAGHPAWLPLGAQSWRAGSVTLEFLLA
jgi:hypothetical protein